MLDSTTLDVAIALAFIFLMVSLLVTAISEMLSGWMKWRSTHLWEGLEQLLQSKEARDRLYAHPLIKGLARVNVHAPDWANGRNGPSYIPSRTFALALIDILRQPHQAAAALEARLQAAAADVSDPAKMFTALRQIAADVSASDAPAEIKSGLAALMSRILPPLDRGVVNALKQRVQQVVDRVPESDRAAIAAAVEDWLSHKADEAGDYVELRGTLSSAIDATPFAAAGSPAAQMHEALRSVLGEFKAGRPEDAVREVQAFARASAQRWLQSASSELQSTVGALSPLLYEAADDIDRFRENIEIWFNDGMDRVSGWYRRHVGVVNAITAIALAVAMNIDALQIMRTLWREPTLRQALVASAGVFTDQHAAVVQSPNARTNTTVDGRTLSVTADRVRLRADDVTRFSVALPAPAAGNAAVRVAPVTTGLLLSPSQGGAFGSGELTLTPPASATTAEFFAKAGSVDQVTLAQLQVSADGIVATPSVVLAPPVDERIGSLWRAVGAMALPIGWSCPPTRAHPGSGTGGPFWCTTSPPSGSRRAVSDWWAVWLKDAMAMLFGWLITAAAASLGAPFWFDTLKRIISIRSSGKAPEEKPLSPKTVPQPREPGQRTGEVDLASALGR